MQRRVATVFMSVITPSWNVLRLAPHAGSTCQLEPNLVPGLVLGQCCNLRLWKKWKRRNSGECIHPLSSATITMATTVGPTEAHFTLNFTVTNLPFTSDLENPESIKSSITRTAMTSLVNPLLNSTSLGPAFNECTVQSFEASKSAATKVNMYCTYTKHSTAATFDRVKLYQELSDKTDGIKTLGFYTLDKNDLYVNGYNKAIPETYPSTVEPPIIVVTNAPVESTQTENFTLNFTITNMPYTADLAATPPSKKFNATSAVMLYLISSILTGSSIGAKYQGCTIDSFSKGTSTDQIKVNAICNMKKEATGPHFDKKTLYQEIKQKTSNITKINTYQLDKNSLYVDGYNGPSSASVEPPVVPVTETPSQTFRPRDFSLNFTITNLPYSPDLQNNKSAAYIGNKSYIEDLLDKLFKKSSIREFFSTCRVVQFKPAVNSFYTQMDSVCTFKVDTVAKAFSKDAVYDEFKNMTNGGKILGNLTLDDTSLLVDGFKRVEATTTTATTTTTTTLSTTKSTTKSTTAVLVEPLTQAGFKLNFTITNRILPNEDVNSPEYQELLRNITNEMNSLYQKSALNETFKGCVVTHLRIGSVMVDCHCYFEKAPEVTVDAVKAEFEKGTNGSNALNSDGTSYNLKGGVEVVPITSSELPFWAIILICLAVLLALILLFLLCFLIPFCLRQRRETYKLEHLAGVYFPHLDLRKLY